MDAKAKKRYGSRERKKLKRHKFILRILFLVVLGIVLIGLPIVLITNNAEPDPIIIDDSETEVMIEDEETETETELILDFTPELFAAMQNELEVRLQEMADQAPGIVGLSYYCLTTGRHIEINADQYFFSASTIKLPAHMLIAEAVQDGNLSWDQYLTFTPEVAAYGSGILQHTIQLGDTLTVAELMRHSIVYSDNVAHRMLIRTFASNGLEFLWNQMDLTNLVFERYLPGEIPAGRLIMTPNQLTEIFRVLYRDRDHIEGYGMILEYMMNTSWMNRFYTELASGYVAHTPGWLDPYSHDSGIFFTEWPYILVVFTSGMPSAENYLAEISDMILEMHLNFESFN